MSTPIHGQNIYTPDAVKLLAERDQSPERVKARKAWLASVSAQPNAPTQIGHIDAVFTREIQDFTPDYTKQ